uniref:Uncharacterized protein n=1 Tax=Leptobrachium leishanense TaxID=445787 RepID=A0A8C5LVN5_9ANUR
MACASSCLLPSPALPDNKGDMPGPGLLKVAISHQVTAMNTLRGLLDKRFPSSLRQGYLEDQEAISRFMNYFSLLIDNDDDEDEGSCSGVCGSQSFRHSMVQTAEGPSAYTSQGLASSAYTSGDFTSSAWTSEELTSSAWTSEGLTSSTWTTEDASPSTWTPEDLSSSAYSSGPVARDAGSATDFRKAPTLAQIASINCFFRVLKCIVKLLCVEMNALRYLPLDHTITIRLKDSIEFRNICTHMTLQNEGRPFDQDLTAAQEILRTLITDLIRAFSLFSTELENMFIDQLKQMLQTLQG